MRRGVALVPALVLALVGTAALGAPVPAVGADRSAAERPRWDTRVFVRMPGGHPAYVHVARSGRVYAGTYTVPDSTAASRVHEWSRDGVALRTWEVPARYQRRDVDHGVQVAAETRDGALVVLETSTASILTLDPGSGRWRRVARLPSGSVPNYATWAPGGLYVSDYARGVIWRVRPDGVVRAWLRDPALDGVAGFGTAALRYLPAQRAFLVTQQTLAPGTAGATPPTSGGLLRVALSRTGAPGRPRLLWTSAPGDLPDGLGVARSGQVYVAMAGPTNRLVELDADGRELDAFPAVPGTGDNGSPVPFDTPCSATFLGTRVLVANQSAVAGDASHMGVLDVEVGEPGLPPSVPASARFD